LCTKMFILHSYMSDAGYDLGSLEKLINTKGADTSVDLLYFVVQQLDVSSPQVKFEIVCWTRTEELTLCLVIKSYKWTERALTLCQDACRVEV
jgi:hypothetical protein